MRTAAALLLMLLPVAAFGAATDSFGPDPYDYHAREQLVRTYRQSGNYVAAYYHAAWLTWLAPKRYATSDAGIKLLRDRRGRDEAAWAASEAVAVAASAVNAERLLFDTCLNGAIPGQASRLKAEVTEILRSAEDTDRRLGRPDPVARMALAHLYLTLDDCLVLEGAGDSPRERPRALQKAISLASAVAERLPKSPGAHLTLAIARARLAEIENREELWSMAIEECEMAQALDPYNPDLSPMVWTLHLRAGHWDEAKRWETGGPRVPRRRSVSPKSDKAAPNG
jgi:hypothetical protein